MPKKKFSKGCVHKQKRDDELIKRLRKDLIGQTEPKPNSVLLQNGPVRYIKGKRYGI